jgi:hypothetical protein
MDKIAREMTDEERDYVSKRSAEYLLATLEAYNRELEQAATTPDNAASEATAAYNTLRLLTLSVIGSIAGSREDTIRLLIVHIEALDEILLNLENQADYTAQEATEAAEEEANE